MNFVEISFYEFENPISLYDKLVRDFSEISMLEFGVGVAELFREVDETTRLYGLPVESNISSDIEENTIVVWLADGNKIFVIIEDIPIDASIV